MMSASAKVKLSEAVFDSIAEMICAYANEATRVAWQDHRKRLDAPEASTESSVQVLEEILSGQAAEDLEFQTRLWGSYFGEILRQQFGGSWELTQYPGGIAAVPTLLVQGARLYPLMKVHRRLTLGEVENLPAFYKMVAGRLGGPAKA
jgi:hypothetical protein